MSESRTYRAHPRPPEGNMRPVVDCFGESQDMYVLELSIHCVALNLQHEIKEATKAGDPLGRKAERLYERLVALMEAARVKFVEMKAEYERALLAHLKIDSAIDKAMEVKEPGPEVPDVLDMMNRRRMWNDFLRAQQGRVGFREGLYQAASSWVWMLWRPGLGKIPRGFDEARMYANLSKIKWEREMWEDELYGSR